MISAIILAAGKSTRMGQQKMLMPWGETTVIGSVIQTLNRATINNIILVTNPTIARQIPQHEIQITTSDTSEMIESLKAGLRALPPSAEAVLICLGDQPQVEEGSVRSVCEAFHKSRSNLIFPSYQMRRGHPWLVARLLWDEILALGPGQSPRDFLNAHSSEIEYVNVNTPTVLQDIDTPEDYLKYKPPL
ncbi:MAG TPA: nucleotidyltransferase family protein, partial [Anaerolineales bacterium]|nr:nucleotidyltransferase family protein [Anaerolineales bacterium]